MWVIKCGRSMRKALQDSVEEGGVAEVEEA
jgi:hypothetical protein